MKRSVGARMLTVLVAGCTLMLYTEAQDRLPLPDPPPIHCRDRFGTSTPTNFRIRSCVACYTYIIRAPPPEFIPHPFMKPNNALIRKAENLTQLFINPHEYEIVYPDINNGSSLSPVCRTLTRKQCELWRECCFAAIECCDRQTSVIGRTEPTDCPATWDGYACWGPTPPDTIAETSCPSYASVGVDRPFGNPKARKTCLNNGTWYKRAQREWTDYTTCLNVQAYRVGLMVSFITNGVSILVLVPAIIIFTSYRFQGLFSGKTEHLTLRRQHRIKVHSNFFFSLLLCAVCSVLWDALITHDMLNTDVISSTRVHQNPAGCRALSAMKIYFSSTNYFWMFCEGYYLHRLLSDAFRPPENLLSLYVIGWAIPAVPVALYCVVRLLMANESCWVYTFGQWNMLYYLPNMLCLAINMLFLCNILRVITTRLQSHPNEPSNFRKGLKAIFILIPLFGLQLFVTIYRPPKDSPGLREYDTFHSFITNSQGFFVAVLFCFFNHEVMNHVRFLRCCHRYGYRRPSRNRSYATSFTTDGNSSSFRCCNDYATRLNSVNNKTVSSSSSAGNSDRNASVRSSSNCNERSFSSPSRAPILAGHQRQCNGHRSLTEMYDRMKKKPTLVTIRRQNNPKTEEYSNV